jgi:hypothetical protein
MTEQDTPGQRLGHGLVYDDGRQAVLLFGGFRPDGKPLADTWSLGDDGWSLCRTVGPPARRWPAMTYDSRCKTMLLTGGRAGVGRDGSVLGDTWTRDEAGWREHQDAGAPLCDHHALVYDAGRDRGVLFGGWHGSNVCSDTWEWDGQHWEPAASTGPTPRAAHAMAYVEHLNCVLLYGGRSLEQFFGDTWRWDGSAWTHVANDGPSPRAFAGMSYERHSQQVVLYGGWDGSHYAGDTWQWDGFGWRKVSDAGPAGRVVYAMAYDPTRQACVVHGGGQHVDGAWRLSDETWEWRANTWTRRY